jgi:4-amino-4-deoxy-L-arabinose transferase-like glycosyltransferase
VRRIAAAVESFRSNAFVLPLLIAASVAAGVVLRVWILRTPELGSLDSDEAVPGLMARHFLHGEFSTFYWGQDYGGTPEVGLLAAAFLVFGSSVHVLRLVPIMLYGIAAVLLWRIGRRTIGEPAATIAGLFFWLWPAYFVWRSTREYGYYGALVVCGLALVLLALRLQDRPNRLDAAGLGVVLGLGWWSSLQIGLVALPALAWLVWRRPSVLRYTLITSAAAIATALPWLIANFRSGWASLETPWWIPTGTYWSRLHLLLTHALPNTVGLRVPVTQQWLPSPKLGQAIFCLLLAALLAQVVFRRRSLEIVAAIIVPLPFLYALSGYTWYGLEPRYLGLLAPLLALLAGALLSDLRLATAGLIAALALSVVGLDRLRDAGGPRYGNAPTTVAPLIRTLDRHGVTRARADYWVAFRVTFLTRERIIVAATPSSRYRHYDEIVTQSARVARIFVSGTSEEAPERPSLLGAGYRRIPTGPYVVYVPPS